MHIPLNFNYTHFNNTYNSLWESSGEIATEEAQKSVPPVTAQETSTGALEGAQVQTILATTPATTVSE